MEKQQILDFLEENKIKLPDTSTLENLEDFKNYINSGIVLKDVIEKWNEFSKGINITELDEQTQLKLMDYRICLKMLRRMCELNLGIKNIPKIN